jgi:class 3 adenylate cyclase
MISPAETDDRAGRLDYRFLVAVDLEGFSKLSTREQRSVQSGLHWALNEAASQADLDREAWLRQVGGDGELAVLPTDTDGVRLVADFPRRLAQVLTAVNDERHPEPRIRVRVAIHHGTLTSGCLGPVGRAPIVVSRLLDSSLLRRELAQRTEADLALIVSASLYGDVIETQLGGLDPSAFHRVVARVKGRAYPAYIYRE